MNIFERELLRKYNDDALNMEKILKIHKIIELAKCDVNLDVDAEYYLDRIEEVLNCNRI